MAIDIDSKGISQTLSLVEKANDSLRKANNNVKKSRGSLDSRISGRISGYSAVTSSLNSVLSSTKGIIDKCNEYIADTSLVLQKIKALSAENAGDISNEDILKLGKGPIIYISPEDADKIREIKEQEAEQKVYEESKKQIMESGYTEVDADRLLKKEISPEELYSEIYEEYCNGNDTRYSKIIEAIACKEQNFNRKELEDRTVGIEETVKEINEGKEQIIQKKEAFEYLLENASYNAESGVYICTSKTGEVLEYDQDSYEVLKVMYKEAINSEVAYDELTSTELTKLNNELKLINSKLSDSDRPDYEFPYNSIEEVDARIDEINASQSEIDKELSCESLHYNPLQYKGWSCIKLDDGSYVVMDGNNKKRNTYKNEEELIAAGFNMPPTPTVAQRKFEGKKINDWFGITDNSETTTGWTCIKTGQDRYALMNGSKKYISMDGKEVKVTTTYTAKELIDSGIYPSINHAVRFDENKNLVYAETYAQESDLATRLGEQKSNEWFPLINEVIGKGGWSGDTADTIRLKAEKSALESEKKKLLETRKTIQEIVASTLSVAKYTFQPDFAEKSQLNADTAEAIAKASDTKTKSGWPVDFEYYCNSAGVSEKAFKGALLARMLSGDAEASIYTFDMRTKLASGLASFILFFANDGSGEGVDVPKTSLISSKKYGAEYHFTNDGVILEFEEYQNWINESLGKGENENIVIPPKDIEIFTYICNTEGYEAGYDYLQTKVPEYDARYTNIKQGKDVKKARSSAWMGLAAAYASITDGWVNIDKIIARKKSGQKLHYYDTYSSANTWNATISADQHKTSPITGYLYDTTSAINRAIPSVIAAYATKGKSLLTTMAINAVINGPSMFSDTVYNAQKRGIDDDPALALAAICTTARIGGMSYSMTKLTGLENTFNNMLTSGEVMSKINALIKGSSVLSKNPELSSNILLTVYCMESQGTVSATTAVSDYAIMTLADFMINGDMSEISTKYKNYKLAQKASGRECSDLEAYVYVTSDMLSTISSRAAIAYGVGSFFGGMQGVQIIDHQRNFEQKINFKEAFEIDNKPPQQEYIPSGGQPGDGGPSGGSNSSSNPNLDSGPSSTSSGNRVETSNNTEWIVVKPKTTIEDDFSDIPEPGARTAFGELAKQMDANGQDMTVLGSESTANSENGYWQEQRVMAIDESGNSIPQTTKVWVQDSGGQSNIESIQQTNITDTVGVKVPIETTIDGNVVDSYTIINEGGNSSGAVTLSPILGLPTINEGGNSTGAVTLSSILGLPTINADVSAILPLNNWLKSVGAFSEEQLADVGKIEEIIKKVANNNNKITKRDFNYLYEKAGFSLDAKEVVLKEFEKDGSIIKNYNGENISKESDEVIVDEKVESSDENVDIQKNENTVDNNQVDIVSTLNTMVNDGTLGENGIIDIGKLKQAIFNGDNNAELQYIYSKIPEFLVRSASSFKSLYDFCNDTGKSSEDAMLSKLSEGDFSDFKLFEELYPSLQRFAKFISNKSCANLATKVQNELLNSGEMIPDSMKDELPKYRSTYDEIIKDNGVFEYNGKLYVNANDLSQDLLNGSINDADKERLQFAQKVLEMFQLVNSGKVFNESTGTRLDSTGVIDFDEFSTNYKAKYLESVRNEIIPMIREQIAKKVEPEQQAGLNLLLDNFTNNYFSEDAVTKLNADPLVLMGEELSEFRDKSFDETVDKLYNALITVAKVPTVISVFENSENQNLYTLLDIIRNELSTVPTDDDHGELSNEYRNYNLRGDSDFMDHTADYKDIKPAMEKLNNDFTELMKIEDTDEYIKQAGILWYKFMLTHPYADGNGRTGRYLLNTLLAQKNITIPSLYNSEAEQRAFENSLDNYVLNKHSSDVDYDGLGNEFLNHIKSLQAGGTEGIIDVDIEKQNNPKDNVETQSSVVVDEKTDDTSDTSKSAVVDSIEGIIGKINLTKEQESILRQQVQRYTELSTQNVTSNPIHLDKDGKFELQAGDLIHVSNIANIESIAQKGILTGQAVGIEEFMETYFCADFFRAPQKESLSKFTKNFRKNYTKGLPSDYDMSEPTIRSFDIGFIVTPTEQNKELLSYDAYERKDSFNAENTALTRTFVNTKGLLDCGDVAPYAANGGYSSVLYGIPANQISTIMVGNGWVVRDVEKTIQEYCDEKKIAVDDSFRQVIEKQARKSFETRGEDVGIEDYTVDKFIDKLHELFPKANIVSYDGTVLYDASKKVDNFGNEQINVDENNSSPAVMRTPDEISETSIEKKVKVLTEDQKRVLSEINKFDLSKFFMGQGASTGGVGLITPKQTIMTDTFIRLERDPSYGDHGQNVDYIYKAIYGKDATVKPSDSITFQDSVMSDGNILIQFCSDISSVIWIPKGINDYQRQSLIKLNEQIKNIYASNPIYFDEHPIEFEIGNEGHFIHCINNIDEYIKDLDNNHYSRYNVETNEVIIEGTQTVSSTTAIDNDIEVIDVSKINTERQNTDMLARGVDPNLMNMSYKGYDFVYKTHGDAANVINQVISENKGGKLLIELDSTVGLTEENLSLLPDNVEIRVIGNYGTENFKGFASNDSGISSLQHATYSISEMQDIMKVINNFESGINPNWNDATKAAYAYDFILGNITYVAHPEGGNVGRAKQFDGLASLLAKESTCQGFAHTYKELLARMGIECTEISGNLNGVGQHAFNVVNIDGENIIVDTTRESLGDKYKGTGFGVENISEYHFRSNIDLVDTLSSMQQVNLKRAAKKIMQQVNLKRAAKKIKQILKQNKTKFQNGIIYDERNIFDGIKTSNTERAQNLEIWARDVVVPKIAEFLGGNIDISKINLNNIILLESDEFDALGVGESTGGFNNGEVSVIKIPKTSVISSVYWGITHELLHQFSRNEFCHFKDINEKLYHDITGFSDRTYNIKLDDKNKRYTQEENLFYEGFNEAVTDYLTGLIISETLNGEIATGYYNAVQNLQKILALNIDGLDLDVLKTSYLNNDISTIKQAIDRIAGEGFFESELCPAFDKSITGKSYKVAPYTFKSGTEILNGVVEKLETLVNVNNQNTQQSVRTLQDISSILQNDQYFVLGHGTGRSVDNVIPSILEQGLRTKDNSLYYTTVGLDTSNLSSLQDKLDNWPHLDSNKIVLVRLPIQYINMMGDSSDLGGERFRAFYNEVIQDDGTVKYYLDPKFIIGVYDVETKTVEMNDKFEETLSPESIQKLEFQYEQAVKQTEERLQKQAEQFSHFGENSEVSQEVSESVGDFDFDESTLDENWWDDDIE